MAGGTASNSSSLRIPRSRRLDDPRTSKFTGTPVILTPASDDPGARHRVPLLREKHITSELANALDRPGNERFDNDVQIVAFHSFKGGVGRTVHAVAMADAVARRGGKVLLIDADLEAPGITWMHRGRHGIAAPEKRLGVEHIRLKLERGFRDLDSQDVEGWRTLWLSCLAAAAGVLTEQTEDVERALTDLGKHAQAVFVVDGLEDLLQSLEGENKRTALRVLLIDVLGWLRSMRGRPLGLVVFVRQDLVTWAVRQNSGQLLGRYEPYALRWDKVEALRLALWVADWADAMPGRCPRRQNCRTTISSRSSPTLGLEDGHREVQGGPLTLVGARGAGRFQRPGAGEGRSRVPRPGSSAVRATKDVGRPSPGTECDAEGPLGVQQ